MNDREFEEKSYGDGKNNLALDETATQAASVGTEFGPGDQAVLGDGFIGSPKLENDATIIDDKRPDWSSS